MLEPLSKLRKRGWQTWELRESFLPFWVWLFGLLFIADAFWQFAWLPEIAAYPRVLMFYTGLALWMAGGVARQKQKRAVRLERERDALKKQLDEFTERRDSEVSE